ncbi:OsmC family protein [Bacillus thermotolerans]|uniref:OsmC/Ohr family protein n=1 Tax=Bacillus thermotolerans TaxID=1221996 RepID=A0A0F5I5E5_BACTR|nr:OsmC family protein [Bacillus thermotolerans]KKB40362.1 OsmC/Ohr family protein [Bacillus thermotolerans]KKB44208.1 OsmC/Ohr family protein [Bacillus thermotolerans]
MKFQMKEGGFTTEFPYGRLDVSSDEAYGFRPYQLMVASIAVCSGGVLRKILAKQRMEVEDIQIEANVERNKEEADRIEKIEVHFLIKGKNLKEEKLKKAMDLTRKNCSMVQSVVPAIEVIETFEMIPAE